VVGEFEARGGAIQRERGGEGVPAKKPFYTPRESTRGGRRGGDVEGSYIRGDELDGRCRGRTEGCGSLIKEKEKRADWI